MITRESWASQSLKLNQKVKCKKSTKIKLFFELLQILLIKLVTNLQGKKVPFVSNVEQQRKVMIMSFDNFHFCKEIKFNCKRKVNWKFNWTKDKQLHNLEQMWIHFVFINTDFVFAILRTFSDPIDARCINGKQKCSPH